MRDYTNLSSYLFHQLRSFLDRELNCVQVVYNAAHLICLKKFRSAYLELQLIRILGRNGECFVLPAPLNQMQFECQLRSSDAQPGKKHRMLLEIQHQRLSGIHILLYLTCLERSIAWSVSSILFIPASTSSWFDIAIYISDKTKVNLKFHIFSIGQLTHVDIISEIQPHMILHQNFTNTSNRQHKPIKR